MTSWNEDNFLEKLMPYRQRGGNSERQTCPDSASLSAFVANELGANEREAMAVHVARCSECAALHDRLVRFSEAPLTVQDVEWKNAEKRLGNWMEDFLRSQPGATLKQPEVETASDGLRFEPKRKRSLSWVVQWALGAVTGLAIVAGGVLLLRFQQLSHSRESEVAVQEESPAVIQSPSDEKRNESTVDDTITTPKRENRRAITIRPTAPVLPDLAAAVPVQEANRQGAEGGEERKESQIADNAPALPSPGADAHLHTSIAQVSPRQRQPSTGRGLHSGGGFLGGSVIRIAPPPLPTLPTAYGPTPAGSSSSPAPAPQALVGVSLDRRASFQIKGDTRIWIQCSSTIPQTDGTFPIQGTLQQPIMQVGTILLAQGTEVHGFATLVGGKISQVVLNQFIVNGTQYSLLNQVSGEANAPLPGAGRIVQFESGQVLELFYDTNSVYQR
jgi:hypothetical protein